VWLLAQTSVWAGGQSYGARQLSDVLVWFFVLGVLAVEVVASEWPETGRRRRLWLGGSLAALLAFSIFVNARGAYSKATWRWNTFDRPPAWALQGGRSRFDPSWVWNWRYPQFMAGLLRHDLEEKLQERDARERLEQAGKATETPRSD
jgi:peptidoglycan/LPS O-acetylase OafA/YrhL